MVRQVRKGCDWGGRAKSACDWYGGYGVVGQELHGGERQERLGEVSLGADWFFGRVRVRGHHGTKEELGS